MTAKAARNEAAIELYRSGVVRAEIRDRLQLSVPQLKHVLSGEKIPTREPSPTDWTDERRALVIKLWNQGYSASQIARQMGGCTRNGIIGVVHRSGASTRTPASAPTARKAPPVKRSQNQGSGNNLAFRQPANLSVTENAVVFEASEPQPPRAIARNGAFKPLPGTTPKIWLQRAFGECAWPVGGEGADIRSCCAPVARGAYCGTHADASTSPLKPGRPRTGNELARSLRRYVA